MPDPLLSRVLELGEQNAAELKRLTARVGTTLSVSTVVSLVFIYIQSSILISSSSARTFVPTGCRIKINIFVIAHSTTPT